MNANLKQRDYHKYDWTWNEIVVEGIKAAMVVIFLAYFFYRSVWAVLPLSIVGILFFRGECKKKLAKCREELGIQFRECILSVVTSMKAGYAVENAFVESRKDMKLLYGEDSLIYEELEGIRRGLVVNITLEEMLFSLGERSDNEHILQFAQVFAIAKRGGGNLSEIMQSTVNLIGQRIDAKREIQTVLSGRKMEQNVMKGMPFAILLYIGISYPGYFDDLYHNLQGIVIMTVCLVIYLAAYALGDHILFKIAKKME